MNRAFFATLLFSLLLAGCVKEISPTAFSYRIPADRIDRSLQEAFPIKRHTPYGEITLTDPRLLFAQNSNRITAGATLHFKNPLFVEQSGSLYLSGIPYYNAQKGAIYLRDPQLEKITLNGYTLDNTLKSRIQAQLQPLIDHLFEQLPIYRIDRETLAGSFVKDISVEKGGLVVRMGL